MKQKLALCCALIHAPRVLFLDEPTTGVDPVSRKEFWEMLKKLKRQHGMTVVVSTPYMDEAMLCDRIALIQNGKFLRVDTPAGIISAYSDTLWAIKSDRMHRLTDDLRSCPQVKTVFPFGETFHVTVTAGAAKEDVASHLASKGHTQVQIGAITATIEDCFMSLMKNSDER